MHMFDWNAYRDQVLAGVGDLGKLSPETIRGYGTLGAKTGHFDAKIRELIALACAGSQKCDGCITVHVEAARKLGATREEIAEALGVAIAIGAGAALVYSTRTLGRLRRGAGSGRSLGLASRACREADTVGSRFALSLQTFKPSPGATGQASGPSCSEHAMSDVRFTRANGAPVVDNVNIETAGPRGPWNRAYLGNQPR